MLLNRRKFVLAASASVVATSIPISAFAVTPVDLATVAKQAIAGASTTREKVAAVISWTHANLRWTATDYQSRSAEEIFARGGGNCFEQAMFVRELFKYTDVNSRIISEVNIQPFSAERQKDAVDRIKSDGVAASVFGARHNDHRWVEYLDSETGEWEPCDATLGIVQTQPWVIARVGFGIRPTDPVIPYADMLFPIAIFARSSNNELFDRTAYYLVDGFSKAYPSIARSPAWPEWRRLLTISSAHLAAAFDGKYNFHQDMQLIADLTKTYAKLKKVGASA